MNSVLLNAVVKEDVQNRWKTFASIVVLFTIGSLLNIPFSRELRRLKLVADNPEAVLSDPVIQDMATFGLSGLLLGAALAFVGLWISKQANLGAPLISQYISKQSVKGLVSSREVLIPIGLAIITACLLLGLFEIQKEFYPIENIISRPDRRYYIPVSFSAGISEEIMFRLGLLSFLVTIMIWISKSEQPTNTMMWSGIFISAVFFGLIHLPLSKNFNELTVFTVGVTMLGNFITGTLYGWIYWKRGLLIAIAAHVAFDLTFHVIGSPYQ